jgi:hypothetical protein
MHRTNTSAELKHLARKRAVRETKQPYAGELEDREAEAAAQSTGQQGSPAHSGRKKAHDK